VVGSLAIAVSFSAGLVSFGCLSGVGGVGVVLTSAFFLLKGRLINVFFFRFVRYYENKVALALLQQVSVGFYWIYIGCLF